MYDKELAFYKNESLKTALTSNAVDMGTDVVTAGQKSLYLVVVITEPIEAAGATVTFNLQASDKESSDFTTVATTGAMTQEQIGTGIALPLPTKTKRYLRVTTEVSATAPTAGKATIHIFDKFNDPCVKALEGSDDTEATA